LFQVSVDSVQVEGTLHTVNVAAPDALGQRLSTAVTCVESGGMPDTENFT